MKNYKGLQIKSDALVHDEVVSLILSKINKGSKILDYGAGEGALSERLSDKGYSVIAADKDEDNFRIDNKKYDKLLFETGSAEIEKRTTTLLKEPSKYDSDITEKIFTDLLKIILLCQRKDDKYKSKKNRRKLCFTEQILYYYYYKNKVPQEYINNIFSNEHIIPFSLNYGDKLDIDRTGNMIPIIDKLNLSRNNNHINSYKKKEEEENIDYVKFIETIPTDDTYNLIVHDKKIINNEEYNNMCDKNETILIDNFINILF